MGMLLRSRVAVCCLLVLSMLALDGLMPGDRAGAEDGLFSSAAMPHGDKGRQFVTPPRRSRFVSINRARLVRSDPATGARTYAQMLRLNLFDDTNLTALLNRIEERSPESFTWFGTVQGQPESTVIMVMNADVMAANIALGDRFYQVSYAGEGVHRIDDLDPGADYPHHDPLVPWLPETAAPDAPAAMADSGSIVDIMVLYTPQARDADGGSAAIESRIDLAVADANTAFERSLVSFRFRLVYKGMVSYPESGDIGTDLMRLTYYDGSMDEVHTLRDSYGADLVSLLISNGGSACGIGWLMQTPSSAFASYAFSVADYRCAAGPYYTLAHEAGHTMGLAHDRANASQYGSHPYAYGYQDPGYFRTILAYACTSSSCPRIANFSNPDVFYNGRPTGVHYQAPNSADNARALNENASIIANWRQSVDQTPPTGSILSPVDGSATNSTSFSINASASDDFSGVKQVEFYATYNGSKQWLCTDTSSPYECAWSPVSIADQSIVFTIDVVDLNDNRATDSGGSRTVILDRQNPSGDISAPADGTTTSDPFLELGATASDDRSGINRVEFFADEGLGRRNACTATSAPYTCTWFAGTGSKTIVLTMDAIDNAGNRVTGPGSRTITLVDAQAYQLYLPVAVR